METALDKLTIKGFKSIKSLEDFELTNLNILIGGNGAGKSNFVGFFRMLQSLMDGKLNEFIREGGGISDFLFNGRKATKNLEFKAMFGPRGYRFKVVPGAKEDVSLTDEARYYQHGSTGWWELGDSVDGTSLLARKVINKSSDWKKGKHVYDAVTSWKIYHFHDTSSTAGMRLYEIIQDKKKLRFNGANIAPYLRRLKKRDKDVYDEIVEAIRLVIPFFNDFILEAEEYGQKKQVNLSWMQKGSDYPMQPYHLSDGSIRFICLATALLQPEPPSTVIIDEPELGLHPYAIEILAELLQAASKRMQVIVSTQSPALVDCFDPQDVVVVNRKDGASEFQRLDAKDLSSWLNDYSLGDLWRKNIVSGGPSHE